MIEAKGPTIQIKEFVEEALCSDMKIDMGLDYFGMLSDRLKRIFYATENKIPSYFPTLDERINGGFPPFTLSVILAATGQGKSLFMANILSRQVLNNKTCVLFSCEMSEDMFAQRFDSIYSGYDINRIYVQKKLQNSLVKSLKKVKDIKTRGELYIKELPTGAATVNDLRIYLRDLQIRGIKPDCIFVDYINLMAANSNNTNKNSNSNEKIKSITRELRSLSMEFQAPVISASQINREGSKLSLKEVDMNFISDAIAIAQDCDFCLILGNDDDLLTYASEIHWKITKNRLGGRTGNIDKLFMDTRSLRLYDSMEYENWIRDAKESGDNRDLAEKDS